MNESKRTTHAITATSAFALSPRQALMWVDDHLFPDARYYNEPLVIELDGPLDRARFAGAWATVIAARDALRMAWDVRGPQQAPVACEPPRLPLVQVAAGEVKPWIAARCARRLPHDDFMWDAALLEVAADRHVFYLCQHHAFTDGLSQQQLVLDLADAYAGRAPAAAPSFREYLDAETAYLASDQASADRAYWEQKLAASTPALRPYGIARTDPSVALDRVWHDAGPTLAARLCERAQQPAFASFSGQLSRLLLLLSASAAFLHRVSGNREVVLAVPFANRSPRFARTCGLLMQQLFLRIGIEDGDTFASLGERVKTELAYAIRHGRACVSSRDIDYFRVNLMPPPPAQFGDLRARVRLDPAAVRAGTGAGAGDLRDTLGIQLYDFSDRSLELAFDCHAATFDARVQQRLRAHFVCVLEALAADGDAVIATVPLVDGAERCALLRGARGREPEHPAPDVVAAFAAQRERRADHVAVEGPDVTLTYAELDAASSRLARRLRSLGVGRESRVGVGLPRGTAELVSFLAVLKAGGAYVPIDPSHPAERVRVVLQDAAPDVLIATPDSALAVLLPARTTLLPLADLEQVTRGFEDAPLDEPVAADQLAYILFTSGSTGRPKGVEITRGAFANFLRSMAAAPGMSEHERLLAVTTTSFDIAGLELFLPLSVGATVVIADRETARDARLLGERLQSEKIAIMQATPATWRLLVESGWHGDGTLRMLCGGEALPQQLARRLLAQGGELWNLYGPTETTVWSTLARIAPDFDRITVGAPIDGTQVYVLDAAMQLVPPGVIGEIYIGGRGLARGYHGRPDLTEQRFVADPFAPPGARLYRTGDLGRLRDDGRIECLGRVDDQVKIRGFRIELGEIETVLRGVPGVNEVVVVARAEAGSEAKLCAYWTGDADQQALFARARERLPDYMVPAGYLRLAAFPLTPSGKIDRNALPAPEPLAQPSGDLRLPETELQRKLAAIWSDVLATPHVGIDQEFFALGGSSVLAVEVRNRIERELGVELPLRAFFETPTIEAIAGRLEGDTGFATSSCLVQLTRGTGERCLFLIHDGDGDVLLYRNLALQMPDDVSVYGVVPPAGRGLPMVHTSVVDLGEHYLREIRARQQHGPYYLAGLCAGGVIAFEVSRRLTMAGERVGLLALIDASAPGARRVPMHVSRQRLHRFGQLLSAASLRDVTTVVAEGSRKLANLASHELRTARSGLDAACRLWLLDHVYVGHRTWPARLPAPGVREIYMRALARYAPEPIAGVNTVLFRATEGIGSVVATRDEFVEPCFGWRALLGGTVEIIDVEGNHSSMLQAGRVETIARRIRRALERPRIAAALPGGIAPALRGGARSVPSAGAHAPAASGTGRGDGIARKPEPTAVTVITVSYRTAALVSRLLATLAHERSRCRDGIDLRVLVIDNASGDAPLLRAAIARHGFAAFTTLIEAPRNGGFAFGNNLGFAHAYGTGRVPDYFFLLNPDTEVRPFAIERLVRFMEQHPDAGIAGSSLESVRGERWPYAYRFPTLLSEAEAAVGWSLVTRLLRRQVVARTMTDAPARVDWMPGASLMVRRDVVDRVGGMDEGYFLYYEETDFCRKVASAGFGVWYVPESRVMHIVGQSTGVTAQASAPRRLPDYWFESRRRYFIKQHGLAYAIATDATTLVACALGRLKLAIQRRRPQAVPRYLRDLARHSALLPRNRELAAAREFHPSRDVGAGGAHAVPG